MPTLLKTAFSLVMMSGGFLVIADAEPPSRLPEDKKPAEKAVAAPLEGGYTIVSGEKDGKPIPEAELKGSVLRITADKIVGTDKDRKEFFAATYTLDTKKEPWVIRMKSTAPKEAEAVGLVKKDGDTVTLVYALPGAEAPKEFKTKDRQHLFVLKRTKVEKPNP
jgi:uncharacterized protein (TIGR03067 family)